MPVQPLINALPDLVLLLRRDGTILDHGGGSGVRHLPLDALALGQRLDAIWPGSLADLIRRLVRRALADRTSAEARFDEHGARYEARISVQGPDRALCIIRAQSPSAALEEANEQISAQLDRRGFLRRFKDSVSLASLREKPTAVAVIDLDGLTDVSQAIDSTVAEQLLSATIVRLSAAPGLASQDQCTWYLGQLNDHQLGLVLETSDREVIEASIAHLTSALREPIGMGDATFHLTPYVGVAILGRDATSPRALLEHARAAASHARRSGAGRACFFSETLRLRSLARIDIARELSEAISNREIRLRYVGRYDLATGRLVAWVGYLRWIHPLRGEIRPVEFLRVAETTGLAMALSRTVLECVQRDFQSLAPHWDRDVRISLGALRHHILHDEFAADIAQLLARGPIAAHRLELRISEKAFIARDLSRLESLQRLGVQLVVDELGRGLGSLDALARAPIWGLQLDRAWVSAVRTNKVASKVCRAGISVASALGLTSIATGVDDAQLRQALLELGCRYGSGDLYQNSMPDIMKPHRAAVSD